MGLMLRSILFQVLFNVGTVLQLIFWMPTIWFLPRHHAWKIMRTWSWLNLWMHHWIIGTRFEFRGIENLPFDEGFIIAAKHQSTWETYAMLTFLKDPSFILKRELMFLPMFGWFATKMKVISVNRGKRGKALASMNLQAKEHCATGRQIVIFPEGTRKNVGDPPAYKYGITHMYRNISVRVLPVALNAGLFWPRQGWRLEQGTIVLEFLPIIEPGLSADEFSQTLEERIETATAALIEEARNDPEFTGKSRN